MADSPESGAEAGAPAQQKQKKGKKKLFLIAAALLLVAALGGGGFFVYRARASSSEDEAGSKKGAGKRAKGKDKDKDEGDDEKGDHEAEGEKKGGEKDEAEEAEADESEVKEVVELQPFIINLADEEEPRYLRMTISLGLAEGEGEEKPDPLYTTKVRNALLNVMTAKRSQDVLTVEGKERLRKQLLSAARKAVDEPHVAAIYITDFIVQL